MNAVLLPIVLFGVLGALAIIKTRNALRVFRWMTDTPDRTMRRLLGVSALPAACVTLSLVLRGLEPPPSLAIGALFMFGTFVASAGVLGVEGALVEPGSEAAARVASGQPPKTSTLGRAVAIALGFVLVAGASGLLWWARTI